MSKEVPCPHRYRDPCDPMQNLTLRLCLNPHSLLRCMLVDGEVGREVDIGSASQSRNHYESVLRKGIMHQKQPRQSAKSLTLSDNVSCANRLEPDQFLSTSACDMFSLLRDQEMPRIPRRRVLIGPSQLGEEPPGA